MDLWGIVPPSSRNPYPYTLGFTRDLAWHKYRVGPWGDQTRRRELAESCGYTARRFRLPTGDLPLGAAESLLIIS